MVAYEADAIGVACGKRGPTATARSSNSSADPNSGATGRKVAGSALSCAASPPFYEGAQRSPRDGNPATPS